MTSLMVRVVAGMLGLADDASDDAVCAAVDRLLAERDNQRMQIDGLRMGAQVFEGDSEGPSDVATLLRELSTPPRHPNAISTALRQVKRLRDLAAKVAPLERDIATLRDEVARLRPRCEALEVANRQHSTLPGERDALVRALRHVRRALRFGLEAGDADVLAVAAESARKGIKRALARLAE